MTQFCPQEILKYARQTNLPQIGCEGQAKLKKASVLCVGAGGIGSPALYYLAAAGIGKIGIIDGDVINTENLQRQILYAEKDCGKLKAHVAKEKLNAINSTVEIKIYPENISVSNALEIISQYDFVLDGSDNYPTRYLVNDAAYFAEKPLVSASVYQFNCQLSVFNYQHGACYRCLYPEAPEENLIPNCAESGILGATTGIIGSLAANEIIKLIIGLPPIYTGTLISLDTLSLSIKKLTFKKSKACVLCSGKINTLEALHKNISSAVCSSLPALEPEALKKLLADRSKNILLIDVRTPAEFQAMNLPGSINVPIEHMHEFPSLCKKYSPNMTVVYCLKGMRSGNVLKALIDQGHKNVFSLKGGIENWLQKK